MELADVIPDIRFEAEFLRTALLLGLVRERDAIAWADELLAITTGSTAWLADVAVTRPELTAVREALRPLGEPSDSATLGRALIAFLATDPAALALDLASRIRLLGQVRRERILADDMHAAIKAFEDRWMLAEAGMHAEPSLAAELDQWLGAVRGAAYFRMLPTDADERDALLGALSRKVVRERRALALPGGAPSAWTVAAPTPANTVIVLNESLWQITVAEFSPLPAGSRIPYASVPHDARLVFDEATAEPLGAREAGERVRTLAHVR